VQGLEVLTVRRTGIHSISLAPALPWEAAEFRAMGTDCTVVVIDGPIGLAAYAEAEVARCEARWSRFRDDSELASLNASAGHGFFAVSRETFALVQKAVELWRVTAGWFDPTVLDALIAAGYDASYELVRDRGTFERVKPARRTPGCAGIEFDADSGAIQLPEGVHLDLGGIGKGCAADVVAEQVIERGARGVCVELGGDISVLGCGPSGQHWNIEVEDPFDETRVLLTTALDNEAIVTSTQLFRRWTTTEGEANHLIDPTTGMSANTSIAAVVARARDAWYAEGIAKAAFVAGPQLGWALAAASEACCWFVFDDRRVITVDATEPQQC
jgi:thiamine biosynthesis lipoprotein